MKNKKSKLVIIGLDEVGRGPLAGDVVAAAVILDSNYPIQGLADSKLLSAVRREELAMEIKAKAKRWAIGRASPQEIDKINILQASFLAMQRAFMQIDLEVNLALIDGNMCPQLPCSTKAIVKGDNLIAEISAASIIAKVTRDAEMRILDKQYPCYGFAANKGYATPYHLEALANHGPCKLHRFSFEPVRKAVKILTA